MSSIQVLNPSLANMIAAGEVVERPSSVVKELVENSIDAGSTEIEVKVMGAGRDLIFVRDDGSGMDKEDVLLAFTRHATSKIHSQKDLFNIETLGFRGEALPSIASVSQVTLKSSTGKVGTKVKLSETNIVSVENSDGRKGTEISVENLFYNTPARLKHMKSDYTEEGNIVDVMNNLALGHPNIKFKLYLNDHLTFQTSGHNDVLEIITDIYGLNTAKNMIPVNISDNDFKIQGYIGQFSISKASRKYMVSLLNGRTVRIPLVQNMLTEAYRNYIPHDRFPMAVLAITCDPTLVDVNVHPSKNEVRLSKDDGLSRLVLDGVRKILLQTQMIPEANIETKTKEVVFQPKLNLDDVLPLNDQHEDRWIKSSDSNTEEASIPLQEKLKTIVEDKPVAKISLRAIGQIHGTYILAESLEGFYIIDQHAAMERINFERFALKMQNEIYFTEMLIPKVVELNFKDINAIKDKFDLFEQVGLKIELFGNNALRVVGVPVWMENVDLDIYISDMVEQIINNSNINIFALRNHAIATLACKASLKANHSLRVEEMQNILDRLLLCENMHTCPHGRPTMLFYSTYDLEKMFKRTGF